MWPRDPTAGSTRRSHAFSAVWALCIFALGFGVKGGVRPFEDGAVHRPSFPEADLHHGAELRGLRIGSLGVEPAFATPRTNGHEAQGNAPRQVNRTGRALDYVGPTWPFICCGRARILISFPLDKTYS